MHDFSRSVVLNDRDARSWFNRGRLLLGLGQFEAALADFERAIALDPKNAEAVMMRGEARLKLGHTHLAISDLTLAIDLDGQLHAARNDRAVALFILGERDAAIADLDTVLKAAPDDPRALTLRCRYRGLAGRQLEAALADCDAALATGSPNTNRLSNRGIVKLRLGRLEEAMADLDAPSRPIRRMPRPSMRARSSCGAWEGLRKPTTSSPPPAGCRPTSAPSSRSMASADERHLR